MYEGGLSHSFRRRVYSIGWLAKINESLQHYEPLKEEKHSMEWLVKTQERLQRRVNEGIYNEMD